MGSKKTKNNFVERIRGKRTPRDSNRRMGTEPRYQSLAPDVLPLTRLGTLPEVEALEHTNWRPLGRQAS